MTTGTRGRVSPREQNRMQLVPLLGEDAATMQGIARSIHRLDEQLCNGYQDWGDHWDYAATERAEKRGERLDARAAELAAAHALLVYIQGDPRGWPVYVYRQTDIDECNKGRVIDSYNPPLDIRSCYSMVAVGVCPK